MRHRGQVEAVSNHGSRQLTWLGLGSGLESVVRVRVIRERVTWVMVRVIRVRVIRVRVRRGG